MTRVLIEQLISPIRERLNFGWQRFVRGPEVWIRMVTHSGVVRPAA